MPLKSQKFHQRWQRALTDHLDGVSLCLEEAKGTKEVEALHDLRVSIRRARVMVRLGRGVCGKVISRAFEGWGKGVSTVAGRVRDYDVTIEWLRAQPGGANLVTKLEGRRNRLARVAAGRVVPMPLNVHKKLVSTKASNRKRNQLKKRYLKWSEELREQVLQCAGHMKELKVEEQHRLRKRLRRLRYLMELVMGRRKQKRSRFLRQLIRVQKALGEMQDRVVVETIFKRLRKTASLRGWCAVARQEHASWLYKAEQELIELKRTDR